MFDAPKSAHTLPDRPLDGRWFCDPQIFVDERRSLFDGRWLCAGPAGDLAKVGDYLTRDLQGEPLLFSRWGDAKDEVCGVYNVCRHRGTRVVDKECGAGAKNFRCPYHAWTYRLDGSLFGAPRMDENDGFDPERAGLVSFPTAVWNGFLFFRLGAEGPASPDEQFATFADITPWTGGELVSAAHRRYDVAANWKILCHNYGECYHCALVHPQLQDISHYLSGGEQHSSDCFVGGPMRLNDGCNTMNMDGRTDRPNLGTVAGEEERLVYFYNLYPNFLLSLHRDYLVSYVLWPVAPDRTIIHCDWLFPPDQVEHDDFDIRSEVEFWDLTNRQDWDICERTQIGVASAGYRPVAYHEGEGCLAEFDRWYLSEMSGRTDR